MKSPRDGECDACGNPGILAGKTPVLLEGGRIIACYECDPSLLENQDDEIKTIRVSIVGQMFANAEGTWYAYKADIDGPREDWLPSAAHKSFGLTGPLGQLARGDIYLVRGKFGSNARYGFQFEAVSKAELAIKESQRGLLNFLTRLPQIGFQRGSEILKRWGMPETLRILEEEPLLLTQISGITEDRALEIKQAYDNALNWREFRAFASENGLTEAVISAALDEWGDDALEQLKEDPFALMELTSTKVNFKTADGLFQRLKKDNKSPERCAAAVFKAFSAVSMEGHTYGFLDDFKNLRGKVGEELRKLQLDSEDVMTGIAELMKVRYVRRRKQYEPRGPFIVCENDRIYLTSLYCAEKQIALELTRILTHDAKSLEFSRDIFGNFEPAPEQVDAIKMACTSQVGVITGGPGCLAEDTVLNITSGKDRDASRPYTMKELFHKFHKIPYPIPKARGYRVRFFADKNHVRVQSARADGSVGYNHIRDVVFNGIKPVYEVISTAGRRLQATLDHPFKVPADTVGADEEGFKCLAKLRVGDTIVVHRTELASPVKQGRNSAHRKEHHVPFHPKARTKIVTDRYDPTRPVEYEYKLVREYRLIIEADMNGLSLQEFIVRLQAEQTALNLVFLAGNMDVHHINEDPQDNRLENLSVMTKAEHARSHGSENKLHFGNQWTEEDVIASITFVGEKPVYDLVMADPDRNYVAQGFVVHNCGKTASLKAVIKTFKDAGLKVALCAFTGIAAKRAEASTGHPATTIHRLLGSSSKTEGVIEEDVIVIDEASMLSTELAAALLSAVRNGGRVLFVGDVDQLPSIEPGRVFYDIIQSAMLPVVRLTKIFRQASDGDRKRIPEVARQINNGENVDLWLQGTDVVFKELADTKEAQDFIVECVTKKLPAKYGFQPEDIMVLSPQRGELGKANWQLGVSALNFALQDALNPRMSGDNAEVYIGGGYKTRAGDRVMHVANNYDLTVFNGDCGEVVRTSAKPFVPNEDVVTSWRTKRAKRIANCEECRGSGKQRDDVFGTRCQACDSQVETAHIIVLVDYEDKTVGYSKFEVEELHLAYASTIHKKQGSQAKAVIFVCHDSHYFMLTRALLYTGITRAEEYVLIVGTSHRFDKAVKNTKGILRRTSLGERLYEEANKTNATSVSLLPLEPAQVEPSQSTSPQLLEGCGATTKTSDIDDGV